MATTHESKAIDKDLTKNNKGNIFNSGEQKQNLNPKIKTSLRRERIVSEKTLNIYPT